MSYYYYYNESWMIFRLDELIVIDKGKLFCRSRWMLFLSGAFLDFLSKDKNDIRFGTRGYALLKEGSHFSNKIGMYTKIPRDFVFETLESINKFRYRRF